MRPVHGLLVVSLLLFVGSVAFIVAGARNGHTVADRTPAPSLAPVANVRQIMTAIVGPAADTVFGAVSTVVTAQGIDEKAPQTDAEWQAVGASAAVIVEAANMLMTEGRAVDRGDWITQSKTMGEAAAVALKAAETKNAKGVFDSGEAIYGACDACHRKYRRTE